MRLQLLHWRWNIKYIVHFTERFVFYKQFALEENAIMYFVITLSAMQS